MQNLAPRINKTHTAIGPRPQHSVARAIAGSMLLSATLIVAATAEEYQSCKVHVLLGHKNRETRLLDVVPIGRCRQ